MIKDFGKKQAAKTVGVKFGKALVGGAVAYAMAMQMDRQLIKSKWNIIKGKLKRVIKHSEKCLVNNYLPKSADEDNSRNLQTILKNLKKGEEKLHEFLSTLYER